MRKYCSYLIPLLTLLFLYSEVNAKKVENEAYIISQLKIKDGLSQSSILSMLQDRIGFMWFGTGSGLNRYDGYSFKVYLNNPQDSLSISDNSISALYEDREGYIWVGTSGGFVNRFDRKTDLFKRINLNLIQNHNKHISDSYFDYPLFYSRNSETSITSISEDDKGRIWIGTWGRGLFIYNKHKEELINLRNNQKDPQSLSYDRITKVLADRNGNIWIGTFGGGINKVLKSFYSKNNNKEYQFQNWKNSKSNKFSLSDNKVTTLHESKNGILWIGTYYGGLNKLGRSMQQENSSQLQFESLKLHSQNQNYTVSNSIMAITEDDSGYIWVGTFGSGVHRLDIRNNSFLNFQHDNFNENSIADNDIISLYNDNSGIIWLGTHLGEGISRLERKNIKFDLIKANPTLPLSINDNVVWSILKDKKNVLWVGTYRGGLNRIDEKRKSTTSYMHDPANPNSLSNNHVRSLAEDKFGNLWVGTYAGGLNRFDKQRGKFTRFLYNISDSTSIGGNQIQRIYIDSSLIMWIAVFGGGLNVLDLKDTQTAKPYFKKYKFDASDSMSISDDRVYTLYEDREKNLWIGTFGGGLNKIDKKSKTFKRYRNDTKNPFSLQNDKVLCLYEDYSGNFWVGTSGSGLIKFDRNTEKFTNQGFKAKIDADVIYGILEDEQSNLWLSTSNGLYKYAYKMGYVTRYDVQDGVQSLEFSGGAYIKTENGEMFFGGINGINRFFPTQVRDDSFIPPVVITSIKIANQSVKGEKEHLRLSYHDNFLSFEFAALSYSNPLNNSYSYMLEGFDEDWKLCDAKYRLANYTNLPAGEYIFRVKGANHDGVWNPVEAKINILINPPYWKTWWFISIVILIITLAIYYLSSIQYRNKLKIEKLKTKLAADLHDNIGSGLTEISILSEIAQKEAASTSELIVHGKLKNISEVARQLIDNMSDIVWVVNPKRDSLNDLLVRLKDSYSDILNSYGISFRISNLDKLDDLTLSMEYRQNLYLIFKEAINNAIKHSKCKKMILKANVRKNVLELVLSDDGVGRDPQNIELGNGIRNMDSRSNNIGGKLKWSSFPGKGTTVKFIGAVRNTNYLKKYFAV